MAFQTKALSINLRIALVFLAVALSLSVGCGGRDLPLVPVQGELTLDGGSCPRSGKISFAPVPRAGMSGMPHRPGWAQFDTNGQFEATLFTPSDGLLPGNYRVRISCVDAPPDAWGPRWR